MSQFDNEIVISGIGGRFPECENVKEFWEALLRGDDLITEDDRRFPAGYEGTCRRQGKIRHPEKFDTSFFALSHKQANVSDCRHRILLETTYESIVDAGYNPRELKGSRTGVYIAITTDTVEYLKREKTDGYFNQSVVTSMAANRISFAFDFQGPSFSCDTACSSSHTAMVCALKDFDLGVIDNAVVGAAHLTFDPTSTTEYQRFGLLAADGKCKTFSKLRDGFARSEGVVTVLLQRRNNCRRMYAAVVGGAVNSDGYKKEGHGFPSYEGHLGLMRQVFNEFDLSPSEVTYFEAHGSGTYIGDRQECEAITQMFGNTRANPLLIGSVKSNSGHAETSSGIFGVAKILGIMHTGIIPANLHSEPIDDSLPGIKDHKLQVVTKNTAFKPGLVATSSLGFGGSNGHLVLKSINETKQMSKKHQHRLVFASGRHVEAVTSFIKGIQENQLDDGFLSLVDEIHKFNIEGHYFRGYTTLGSIPKLKIKKYEPNERQIWFIYSGMGGQWLTMGKDLLKIEIFETTFNRCAAALKPYQIDLHRVVTSSDPSVFEDITNCFVAITATQVALTDVLKSFQITPDRFAGHSLGEVACGYVNGSLTCEQAVLVAYARGYCVAKAKDKIIKGLMVAVGLSNEEITPMLPDGIYVACINSSTNVTIAGPEIPMRCFMKKLQAAGAFVKEVHTGNIAFHSKYIQECTSYFEEFTRNVIKQSKPRKSEWISTSIPLSKERETWNNFDGVEYHLNNFSNQVLFHQIFEHVPENAIVIEIAPRGLLQGILKRQLPPSVTNISLTSRQSTDGEEYFMAAIGKLYLEGCQPQLNNFYKNIAFPVGAKVSPISPLIKWDHSMSWLTPKLTPLQSFYENILIKLSSSEFSHLRGHQIDDRIIIPGMTYLLLVWKVFAKINLKTIESFPISFEKIHFKRASVLPNNEEVRLLLSISPKEGYFEIFESGSSIVTGTIRAMSSCKFQDIDKKSFFHNSKNVIQREDFYKAFHLRNYNYDDCFQEIIAADFDKCEAILEWYDKFDCFLDGLLQMQLLHHIQYTDVFLTTYIGEIIIDPVVFLNTVNEQKEIPVVSSRILNVTECNGIRIKNVNFTKTAHKQQVQTDPELETNEFVYYNQETIQMPLCRALTIALEIVLQNCAGLVRELVINEFANNPNDAGIIKICKEILKKKLMTETAYFKYEEQQRVMFDIIILEESTLDENIIMLDFLSDKGFILYHGTYTKIENLNLNLIFQCNTPNGKVFLLRKSLKQTKKYSVLHIKNTDLSWVEELKTLLHDNKSNNELVYLVSKNENTSGIIGLTNCLRKEITETEFHFVFIQDTVRNFTLDDDITQKQLNKNLVFNVLREGCWGTYVYLPLEHGPVETTNARIEIGAVGDLSSFKWTQGFPIEYEKDGKDKEIDVYYAALNFKDVLLATGKLQQHSPHLPVTAPGLEFSGIMNGKRVMSIVSSAAISLKNVAPSTFVWDVPDEWTLEEAVTVPSVYATAYYALIVRANIQPEESILIHAGSGGIGISAISIALSMGCKVFTTVSTCEKREFLKGMFPQLEDENIGDSRSRSFETMILEQTGGKGVDVVLNSLAGPLFQASMNCLGEQGRFLELGKVDFINRTLIDSYIFLKNCSFHGIMLDNLYYSDHPHRKLVVKLVQEGIENGVVKPLPRTVFGITEIEEAFRFMGSGKHKGKVVIRIRHELPRTVKPPEMVISAVPQIYFNPKKSYIIIGGLGGVGLELTDWLIRKGAEKIILNSKMGITNGYQQLCLKKWRNYKLEVIVNCDDSADEADAKRLIMAAKKLAPVGGIFNLALVLRDSLMKNITKENFEEVLSAKFLTTQNMDKETRRSCPDLDHFVIFSSIASGLGNSGQTNYGMANSIMERICEMRRLHNLPGLAVQFGPIAQVGALLRVKLNKQVQSHVEPQMIASCFEALEKFMLQSCPIGLTAVRANKSTNTMSCSNRTLTEMVSHILGINCLNDIDKNLTLLKLGIDSLMVSEVKHTLYTKYHIDIDTDEIQELTFENLIEFDSKGKNLGLPTKHLKTGPENTDITDKFHFVAPAEVVIEMNKYSDDRNKVFFLHPIEGHVEAMELLAESLKSKVYGLQCSTNCSFDTIAEFSMYYESLIRNIQPEGPYVICGYSYGAVLALEIGKLLEEDDQQVVIVSIDSSPDYCKFLINSYFEKMDPSFKNVLSRLLTSFSTRFLFVDEEKINEIITSSDDWESQKYSVCHYLSKTFHIEVDLLKTSVELLRKRLFAMYHYQWSNIFKGRILLIRQKVNLCELSEAYNLEKICPSVQVVMVDADHTSIMTGENVKVISDIINELVQDNSL